MGSRQVTLTVLRFDPTRDTEPRYESYAVEHVDQMKVLDALRTIYEEQDGSLAYRWACGIAKCGTCTVYLDGRPVLACQHPLPDRDVVIEPMPRHPVLVDLIVDRDRVVPPPPGRLGDRRRAETAPARLKAPLGPNASGSIKGGI